MPKRSPASAEDLHARAGRRKDELRAIGAGVIALIAIGFGDLSSKIADDSPRPLFAVFVTAVFLAGLGLAYAWPWFGRVLTATKGSGADTSVDDKSLRLYHRAPYAGQVAIGFVLLGALCYLTATWFWAS